MTHPEKTRRTQPDTQLRPWHEVAAIWNEKHPNKPMSEKLARAHAGNAMRKMRKIMGVLGGKP